MLIMPVDDIPSTRHDAIMLTSACRSRRRTLSTMTSGSISKFPLLTFQTVYFLHLCSIFTLKIYTLERKSQIDAYKTRRNEKYYVMVPHIFICSTNTISSECFTSLPHLPWGISPGNIDIQLRSFISGLQTFCFAGLHSRYIYMFRFGFLYYEHNTTKFWFDVNLTNLTTHKKIYLRSNVIYLCKI